MEKITWDKFFKYSTGNNYPNEIIVRFKGGDIVINWNNLKCSNIKMIGGYEEIFSASIEL